MFHPCRRSCGASVRFHLIGASSHQANHGGGGQRSNTIFAHRCLSSSAAAAVAAVTAAGLPEGSSNSSSSSALISLSTDDSGRFEIENRLHNFRHVHIRSKKQFPAALQVTLHAVYVERKFTSVRWFPTPNLELLQHLKPEERVHFAIHNGRRFYNEDQLEPRSRSEDQEPQRSPQDNIQQQHPSVHAFRHVTSRGRPFPGRIQSELHREYITEGFISTTWFRNIDVKQIDKNAANDADVKAETHIHNLQKPGGGNISNDKNDLADAVVMSIKPIILEPTISKDKFYNADQVAKAGLDVNLLEERVIHTEKTGGTGTGDEETLNPGLEENDPLSVVGRHAGRLHASGRHLSPAGKRLPPGMQHVLEPHWQKHRFTSTKWYRVKDSDSSAKVRVGSEPVEYNGDLLYNEDQLLLKLETNDADTHHPHGFRHKTSDDKVFPSFIQCVLHRMYVDRGFTSTKWYRNVNADAIKPGQVKRGVEVKSSGDVFHNAEQLRLGDGDAGGVTSAVKELQKGRHLSPGGKLLPLAMQHILEPHWQTNGFTSTQWYRLEKDGILEVKDGAAPINYQNDTLYNGDQIISFSSWRHRASSGKLFPHGIQKLLENHWQKHGFISTTWHRMKSDGGGNVKLKERGVPLGGVEIENGILYNEDQVLLNDTDTNTAATVSEKINAAEVVAKQGTLTSKHEFRHKTDKGSTFPGFIQQQLHHAWCTRGFNSTTWYRGVHEEHVKPEHRAHPVTLSECDDYYNQDQLVEDVDMRRSLTHQTAAAADSILPSSNTRVHLSANGKQLPLRMQVALDAHWVQQGFKSFKWYRVKHVKDVEIKKGCEPVSLGGEDVFYNGDQFRLVDVEHNFCHTTDSGKKFPGFIQRQLHEAWLQYGFTSTVWYRNVSGPRAIRFGEDRHTDPVKVKASVQNDETEPFYNADQLEADYKLSYGNKSNKSQLPDRLHLSAYGNPLPMRMQAALDAHWVQQGLTSLNWYRVEHVKHDEVKVGSQPVSVDEGGETMFYNADQLELVSADREEHTFRHKTDSGKAFPGFMQETLHKAWLRRGFTSITWYRNVDPLEIQPDQSEPVVLKSGNGEEDHLYNADQLVDGHSGSTKRKTKNRSELERVHLSSNGNRLPFRMQTVLDEHWVNGGFTSLNWHNARHVTKKEIKEGSKPVSVDRGSDDGISFYNADQVLISPETAQHGYRHKTADSGKAFPAIIQRQLHEAWLRQAFTSTTWHRNVNAVDVLPDHSVPVTSVDESGNGVEMYNADQLVEGFGGGSRGGAASVSTLNDLERVHLSRNDKRFPLCMQVLLDAHWVKQGFTSLKWYRAEHVKEKKIKVGSESLSLGDYGSFYNGDQLDLSSDKTEHDFRHKTASGKAFPGFIQESLHEAWLRRGFTSTTWYRNVNALEIRPEHLEPLVLKEQSKNGEKEEHFYNEDQLVEGHSAGSYSPPPPELERYHLSSNGKRFPMRMQVLLDAHWVKRGLTSLQWYLVERVRKEEIKADSGEPVRFGDDGEAFYNGDQLELITSTKKNKKEDYHDFRHRTVSGRAFPGFLQQQLHEAWLRRGFTSTTWQRNVNALEIRPENVEPVVLQQGDANDGDGDEEHFYNEDQLIEGHGHHSTPSNCNNKSADPKPELERIHLSSKDKRLPMRMQAVLDAHWVKQGFKSFKWYQIAKSQQHGDNQSEVLEGAEPVIYNGEELFNEDQLVERHEFRHVNIRSGKPFPSRIQRELHLEYRRMKYTSTRWHPGPVDPYFLISSDNNTEGPRDARGEVGEVEGDGKGRTQPFELNNGEQMFNEEQLTAAAREEGAFDGGGQHQGNSLAAAVAGATPTTLAEDTEPYRISTTLPPHSPNNDHHAPSHTKTSSIGRQRKHLSGKGTPFPLRMQDVLESHWQRMGFTSCKWYRVRDRLGELKTPETAVPVVVEGEELFNEDQLDGSRLHGFRHVTLSGGKPFPTWIQAELHKEYISKKYTSTKWFHGPLPLLERNGQQPDSQEGGSNNVSLMIDAPTAEHNAGDHAATSADEQSHQTHHQTQTTITASTPFLLSNGEAMYNADQAAALFPSADLDAHHGGGDGEGRQSQRDELLLQLVRNYQHGTQDGAPGQPGLMQYAGADRDGFNSLVRRHVSPKGKPFPDRMQIVLEPHWQKHGFTSTKWFRVRDPASEVKPGAEPVRYQDDDMYNEDQLSAERLMDAFQYQQQNPLQQRSTADDREQEEHHRQYLSRQYDVHGNRTLPCRRHTSPKGAILPDRMQVVLEPHWLQHGFTSTKWFRVKDPTTEVKPGAEPVRCQDEDLYNEDQLAERHNFRHVTAFSGKPFPKHIQAELHRVYLLHGYTSTKWVRGPLEPHQLRPLLLKSPTETIGSSDCGDGKGTADVDVEQQHWHQQQQQQQQPVIVGGNQDELYNEDQLSSDYQNESPARHHQHRRHHHQGDASYHTPNEHSTHWYENKASMESGAAGQHNDNTDEYDPLLVSHHHTDRSQPDDHHPQKQNRTFSSNSYRARDKSERLHLSANGHPLPFHLQPILDPWWEKHGFTSLRWYHVKDVESDVRPEWAGIALRLNESGETMYNEDQLRPGANHQWRHKSGFTRRQFPRSMQVELQIVYEERKFTSTTWYRPENTAENHSHSEFKRVVRADQIDFPVILSSGEALFNEDQYERDDEEAEESSARPMPAGAMTGVTGAVSATSLSTKSTAAGAAESSNSSADSRRGIDWSSRWDVSVPKGYHHRSHHHHIDTEDRSLRLVDDGNAGDNAHNAESRDGQSATASSSVSFSSSSDVSKSKCNIMRGITRRADDEDVLFDCHRSARGKPFPPGLQRLLQKEWVKHGFKSKRWYNAECLSGSAAGGGTFGGTGANKDIEADSSRVLPNAIPIIIRRRVHSPSRHPSRSSDSADDKRTKSHPSSGSAAAIDADDMKQMSVSTMTTTSTEEVDTSMATIQPEESYPILTEGPLGFIPPHLLHQQKHPVQRANTAVSQDGQETAASLMKNDYGAEAERKEVEEEEDELVVVDNDDDDSNLVIVDVLYNGDHISEYHHFRHVDATTGTKFPGALQTVLHNAWLRSGGGGLTGTGGLQDSPLTSSPQTRCWHSTQWVAANDMHRLGLHHRDQQEKKKTRESNVNDDCEDGGSAKKEEGKDAAVGVCVPTSQHVGGGGTSTTTVWYNLDSLFRDSDLRSDGNGSAVSADGSETAGTDRGSGSSCEVRVRSSSDKEETPQKNDEEEGTHKRQHKGVEENEEHDQQHFFRHGDDHGSRFHQPGLQDRVHLWWLHQGFRSTAWVPFMTAMNPKITETQDDTATGTARPQVAQQVKEGGEVKISRCNDEETEHRQQIRPLSGMPPTIPIPVTMRHMGLVRATAMCAVDITDFVSIPIDATAAAGGDLGLVSTASSTSQASFNSTASTTSTTVTTDDACSMSTSPPVHHRVWLLNVDQFSSNEMLLRAQEMTTVTTTTAMCDATGATMSDDGIGKNMNIEADAAQLGHMDDDPHHHQSSTTSSSVSAAEQPHFSSLTYVQLIMIPTCSKVLVLSASASMSPSPFSRSGKEEAGAEKDMDSITTLASVKKSCVAMFMNQLHMNHLGEVYPRGIQVTLRRYAFERGFTKKRRWFASHLVEHIRKKQGGEELPLCVARHAQCTSVDFLSGDRYLFNEEQLVFPSPCLGAKTTPSATTTSTEMTTKATKTPQLADVSSSSITDAEVSSSTSPSVVNSLGAEDESEHDVALALALPPRHIDAYGRAFTVPECMKLERVFTERGYTSRVWYTAEDFGPRIPLSDVLLIDGEGTPSTSAESDVAPPQELVVVINNKSAYADTAEGASGVALPPAVDENGTETVDNDASAANGSYNEAAAALLGRVSVNLSSVAHTPLEEQCLAEMQLLPLPSTSVSDATDAGGGSIATTATTMVEEEIQTEDANNKAQTQRHDACSGVDTSDNDTKLLAPQRPIFESLINGDHICPDRYHHFRHVSAATPLQPLPREEQEALHVVWRSRGWQSRRWYHKTLPGSSEYMRLKSKSRRRRQPSIESPTAASPSTSTPCRSSMSSCTAAADHVNANGDDTAVADADAAKEEQEEEEDTMEYYNEEQLLLGGKDDDDSFHRHRHVNADTGQPFPALFQQQFHEEWLRQGYVDTRWQRADQVRRPPRYYRNVLSKALTPFIPAAPHTAQDVAVKGTVAPPTSSSVFQYNAVSPMGYGWYNEDQLWSGWSGVGPGSTGGVSSTSGVASGSSGSGGSTPNSSSSNGDSSSTTTSKSACRRRRGMGIDDDDNYHRHHRYRHMNVSGRRYPAAVQEILHRVWLHRGYTGTQWFRVDCHGLVEPTNTTTMNGRGYGGDGGVGNGMTAGVLRGRVRQSREKSNKNSKPISTANEEEEENTEKGGKKKTVHESDTQSATKCSRGSDSVAVMSMREKEDLLEFHRLRLFNIDGFDAPPAFVPRSSLPPLLPHHRTSTSATPPVTTPPMTRTPKSGPVSSRGTSGGAGGGSGGSRSLSGGGGGVGRPTPIWRAPIRRDMYANMPLLKAQRDATAALSSTAERLRLADEATRREEEEGEGGIENENNNGEERTRTSNRRDDHQRRRRDAHLASVTASHFARADALRRRVADIHRKITEKQKDETGKSHHQHAAANHSSSQQEPEAPHESGDQEGTAASQDNSSPFTKRAWFIPPSERGLGGGGGGGGGGGALLGIGKGGDGGGKQNKKSDAFLAGGGQGKDVGFGTDGEEALGWGGGTMSAEQNTAITHTASISLHDNVHYTYKGNPWPRDVQPQLDWIRSSCGFGSNRWYFAESGGSGVVVLKEGAGDPFAVRFRKFRDDHLLVGDHHGSSGIHATADSVNSSSDAARSGEVDEAAEAGEGEIMGESKRSNTHHNNNSSSSNHQHQDNNVEIKYLYNGDQIESYNPTTVTSYSYHKHGGSDDQEKKVFDSKENRRRANAINGQWKREENEERQDGEEEKRAEEEEEGVPSPPPPPCHVDYANRPFPAFMQRQLDMIAAEHGYTSKVWHKRPMGQAKFHKKEGHIIYERSETEPIRDPHTNEPMKVWNGTQCGFEGVHTRFIKSIQEDEIRLRSRFDKKTT